MDEREIYSIQTIATGNNGKEYRHEIGELSVVRSAENTQHYLKLFMFPDTKISIRKKI